MVYREDLQILIRLPDQESSDYKHYHLGPLFNEDVEEVEILDRWGKILKNYHGGSMKNCDVRISWTYFEDGSSSILTYKHNSN